MNSIYTIIEFEETIWYDMWNAMVSETQEGYGRIPRFYRTKKEAEIALTKLRHAAPAPNFRIVKLTMENV